MKNQSKKATQPGRLFLFFILLSGITLECVAGASIDLANTGFQLMEEGNNPRVVGLGGAGTAVPGRGFFQYNPALPGLTGQSYLALEFGTYPQGDLRRGLLETAWTMKSFFLGIALKTETISDIFPSTIAGPNYNNPFTAQLTEIALGLGYMQDGPFSLGITIHGVQDRIYNSAGYALAASLGATYAHIPEKLTFGAALIHPKIGDGELYTSTSLADTTFDVGYGADLPSSFRAGGFWKDTLKSIPYAIAADLVLRTPGNKFMAPVGVEVRPIAPLAIRMGKRLFLESELINLGLGLEIAPLGVDISFVVPRLIDDAEVKFLAALTYTPREKTEKRGKVKKTRDDNTLVIPPAEETKVTADTTISRETDAPDTNSPKESGSTSTPETDTPHLELGPVSSEEAEVVDSETAAISENEISSVPEEQGISEEVSRIPPNGTAETAEIQPSESVTGPTIQADEVGQASKNEAIGEENRAE